MSWSSASMDLVSEKNELDAFLSRCIELKPGASEKKIPEAAQRMEESADLMGHDRQAFAGLDEGREKPGRPEPMERADDEPLTTAAAAEFFEAGPAVMETPPVQAGPEELTVESPVESVSEFRTEAPPEVRTEAGSESAAPVIEDAPRAGMPETAEDARRKEFDVIIEREDGPAPQLDIVIPRTHFGPDDQLNDREVKTSEREIIVDESCADTPNAIAEERQYADEERMKKEKSAAVQDRSSLRKPSRNAAAIAYARKKEKKTKSLLVVLYIIIAIVLGVEAFLYIFPDAGYRIADAIGRQMNIISGREVTKANPANARKEVRQTVQQRITRDGNNESK